MGLSPTCSQWSTKPLLGSDVEEKPKPDRAVEKPKQISWWTNRRKLRPKQVRTAKEPTQKDIRLFEPKCRAHESPQGAVLSLLKETVPYRRIYNEQSNKHGLDQSETVFPWRDWIQAESFGASSLPHHPHIGPATKLYNGLRTQQLPHVERLKLGCVTAEWEKLKPSGKRGGTTFRKNHRALVWGCVKSCFAHILEKTLELGLRVKLFLGFCSRLSTISDRCRSTSAASENPM